GSETLIVAVATLAPAIALIVTVPEAMPCTTPWMTLATVLSLELHVTKLGAFTTMSWVESPTNTFDESGLTCIGPGFVEFLSLLHAATATPAHKRNAARKRDAPMSEPWEKSYYPAGSASRTIYTIVISRPNPSGTRARWSRREP